MVMPMVTRGYPEIPQAHRALWAWPLASSGWMIASQPLDALGLPDDIATKVEAHWRAVARIVHVILDLTAADGLTTGITSQPCSISRLDRAGNEYGQSTDVDALANASTQRVIPQLRLFRHVAPPDNWYSASGARYGASE
jgi:hypothetical protein